MFYVVSISLYILLFYGGVVQCSHRQVIISDVLIMGNHAYRKRLSVILMRHCSIS